MALLLELRDVELPHDAFPLRSASGGIDDCFEACSLIGRLLSQEWEGVYWVATRMYGRGVKSD